MSTLTRLSKVWDKVQDLSKDHWDNLAPTKDIRFVSLDTMNIGSDSHLLTGQAQNQIAIRLGVPMTYLKKCPPSVQAYNLNHWIKEERNDKMFIRFNGPKIRASLLHVISRWIIKK